MLLRARGSRVDVTGDETSPVSRGALCVKGWTSAQLLAHGERLTRPLVRLNGVQTPVSWEDALGYAADRLMRIQAVEGYDSIGVFGGGCLTNEKAYLLGKFARVALRTSNIDYNGRFCMSSAAAASIRAFGIDRGLPFPLDDIPGAEVVLIAGGNPAETMPPIMRYFDEQRRRGGRMIVVDPRATATARAADLHLKLAPGSDALVANGLLHVLVREGLVDLDYVARRTRGFDTACASAAACWPERVERLSGVEEAMLTRAARMLGTARSAMILTARGAEQHALGVRNTLAYINLALALGLPGKPDSGFGCLTGQGNGQGGREHGQKADQLPGYRRIDDPAARRHIAGVWNVPEESIPGPGRSAYELLDTAGTAEGIKGLLVFGSNPAVSSPNLTREEIFSELRLASDQPPESIPMIMWAQPRAPELA